MWPQEKLNEHNHGLCLLICTMNSVYICSTARFFFREVSWRSTFPVTLLMSADLTVIWELSSLHFEWMEPVSLYREYQVILKQPGQSQPHLGRPHREPGMHSSTSVTITSPSLNFRVYISISFIQMWDLWKRDCVLTKLQTHMWDSTISIVQDFTISAISVYSYKSKVKCSHSDI